MVFYTTTVADANRPEPACVAVSEAPGHPLRALWTVVLAAGGSRRLGRPKQLVRFRNRTLLDRATSLAANLTPDRVVVVVGAERLRILRHLQRTRHRVSIRVNPQWRDGMAGSLARGLEAVPASAAGVLVLVTDQPLIERRHLALLAARWRARPFRPVAARYTGRLGVPAIVPRRYFSRLIGVGGDSGARTLLRDRDLQTQAVDIAAAAVDIDTAADVAALDYG